MSEKVACVVLNYNDADNTLNLIEKIHDYNSLNYIVVVDNCSSDDSVSRIQDIVDEKVKLLQQDKNQGYGAGNNAGVRYAHDVMGCKYAIIANPDVLFSRECVMELKRVMQSDSQIAVSAPIQKQADGTIEKEYAWHIPTIRQWVWSPEHFLHKYFWPCYTMEELKQARSNGAQTMNVDCVPGAMLMVDTDKFLECEGYDEDNFLYCEETVLGIKLKGKQYKTELLINQYYVHLGSETINKNIEGRAKRKAIMMNSRLWFLKNWLKASPIQCWMGKLVADLAVFETRISDKTGIS